MNSRQISLLAMLVWPVVGVLISLRHIDQFWELILFFSGFTGLLFVLLIPETMLLSVPGAVILYSAGMAMWLVPLRINTYRPYTVNGLPA